LSANGWDIYTANAELYDPMTGNWTATGSMATARSAPALLLQNGKVLVVGGMDSTPSALASAEIFDPANGSWTPAASMAWARIGHSATLLSDGKVLIAGGYVTCPASIQPCDSASTDAEIYDPTAGTWTAAGMLNTMRRFHAATLLDDGRVLVAGGATATCSPTTSNCISTSTSSAELYDPSTGSWTPTGSMHAARQSSQIRLKDGRVLAAGGSSCRPLTNHVGSTTITTAAWTYLVSAEIYDPATGTWTTTGSLNMNHGEPIKLLCTGNVLVAAGYDPSDRDGSVNYMTASAEIYDPSAGTWSFTGSLATPRDSTAVAELSDGRVLVVGGQSPTGYQSGAEIYH
jgi:N-acetylneuraminic acid mutarotase